MSYSVQVLLFLAAYIVAGAAFRYLLNRGRQHR